jgi:hypothetical protein
MRATGSPVKTSLNRRGKGRTGIRGRRQDARQQGTLEILERHLARRISITVTGDSKQVSVLEAIVLQLIQKTLLGSERACRTLLKYQAFANRRTAKSTKLRFAESEYTRALAKFSSENNDG